MRWDEDALNRQRVERILTLPTEGDGVQIFDDTGFPKQGNASVGGAREYPTGRNVTAAELKAIRPTRHETCPQWNYAIHPRTGGKNTE